MATKKAVANFFVNKGVTCPTNKNNFDGSVSPFKLQRLMYYAQALYVTLTDELSIFDDHEDFIAYAHGPVLLSIYNKYKVWGYRWIIEVDLSDQHTITEGQTAILEHVWSMYGGLSAKQLEQLATTEEPWLLARGTLPEGYSSFEVVSVISMKRYYKQQFVEF